MKQKRNEEHRYRINNEIRAKQVKLVGDNVTIGNYSIQDATRIADNLNLDLVEINNSNPELPICKVLDFGKFLYEKKKNDKKPQKTEVKELRLRPATSDNDLMVKVNRAKDWLDKGNMVKALVFFKGRELTHKELGYEILNKVVIELDGIGVVDKLPVLEGPRLTIMIKPKK